MGTKVSYQMFQLTNFMMLGTFYEIIWVVDTLSARQNFLASHKHVIRVGIFGVVGVGHRVERPDREWELVQDVKISVVFGLHQPSEQLLVWCRHVFFVTHLNASVTQHFHALVELEPEWRFKELESVDVVLLTNSGDLRSVAEKINNH